jgi:hypothetical protein
MEIELILLGGVTFLVLVFWMNAIAAHGKALEEFTLTTLAKQAIMIESLNSQIGKLNEEI